MKQLRRLLLPPVLHSVRTMEGGKWSEDMDQISVEEPTNPDISKCDKVRFHKKIFSLMKLFFKVFYLDLRHL